MLPTGCDQILYFIYILPFAIVGALIAHTIVISLQVQLTHAQRKWIVIFGAVFFYLLGFLLRLLTIPNAISEPVEPVLNIDSDVANSDDLEFMDFLDAGQSLPEEDSEELLNKVKDVLRIRNNI